MDIAKYTNPTALEASPLDALPMGYFWGEAFNASGRVVRGELFKRANALPAKGNVYLSARTVLDVAAGVAIEAGSAALCLYTGFAVGNGYEGHPAQGALAFGSGIAALFGSRLIAFGMTRYQRRQECREISDVLVE